MPRRAKSSDVTRSFDVIRTNQLKALGGQPPSSLGKKATVYISVNMFVNLMAYLSYTMVKYFNKQLIAGHYLASILRSGLSILFIIAMTANKELIGGSQRNSLNCLEYGPLIFGMLLNVALTDIISLYVGQSLLVATRSAHAEQVGTLHVILSIALQFLYFIPISFVFELIYDFCHYWSHRISHKVKWLYRLTHKSHHRHHHPHPLVTFDQSLSGLIFTNVIPICVALFALSPYLTIWRLHLIFAYKIYIEVAGHSGVVSRACTFPQLPCLPQMIGIGLMTEDHDLHHCDPSVNFSKRFSLWDKVFGTFKK